MSVVLGRRHRLLHVRALLARRNGREQENTSSSLLTSFRFPITTSRKGDPTGTATGRKKGITSTSSRIKKKCKKREFLGIHDRFIRDERFRKTINWVALKKDVVRWTNWRTRITHTTPLQKKLVCTATIGGSVRILLVLTRCP